MFQPILINIKGVNLKDLRNTTENTKKLDYNKDNLLNENVLKDKNLKTTLKH